MQSRIAYLQIDENLVAKKAKDPFQKVRCIYIGKATPKGTSVVMGSEYEMRQLLRLVQEVLDQYEAHPPLGSGFDSLIPLLRGNARAKDPFNTANKPTFFNEEVAHLFLPNLRARVAFNQVLGELCLYINTPVSQKVSFKNSHELCEMSFGVKHCI